MRKSRASDNSVGTIVLIVVIFLVVLAVSVLLQADFSSFGKTTASDPSVTYLPGEQPAVAGTGTVDNEAAYNWNECPIYIIGDSLTQGARKEIADVLPDAMIDGKVSRNMDQGLSILEGLDEQGTLEDDAIIVVCLANNITGETLDRAQEVVDMIDPGQSLIMMTGHGRKNMDPVNTFIRGLPLAYGFVTVADWDLTIEQSPSLLSDDGIHISKKQGNELYADLIMRALEATKPKE